MPLQALISRLPFDANDVIAVRPDTLESIKIWGSQERDSRSFFVVRLLDDFHADIPLLQKMLDEMALEGIGQPVIVNPFAVYEEVVDVNQIH